MRRFALAQIGVVAMLIGGLNAMRLNQAQSPFEAFWCGSGQFAATDAGTFAYGHCGWCALALAGLIALGSALLQSPLPGRHSSVSVAV